MCVCNGMCVHACACTRVHVGACVSYVSFGQNEGGLTGRRGGGAVHLCVCVCVCVFNAPPSV